MKDPVAETIASYQAKADEYIQNTNRLDSFPDLPAMLDKFIQLLPGAQVLDVAFGSGRDSIYLIDHGVSVTGIELTQAFIDAYPLSNPIAKMDMRRLLFDGETFDGLWCCASFLHIPRDEALATLQGFHRVLRMGGILYVDVKEGSGEEWKAEGNVSDSRRYFTLYMLDEIVDLLHRAHFQILFTRRQAHARQNIKSGWLNIFCRKA